MLIPPKKEKLSVRISPSGLIILSRDLSEKIIYGNVSLAVDEAYKGKAKDWYLIDIEGKHLFHASKRNQGKHLGFNNKVLAQLFLSEFKLEKGVTVKVGPPIQTEGGFAYPLITAALVK